MGGEDTGYQYILETELVQILAHEPRRDTNPGEVLGKITHKVDDGNDALCTLFCLHQGLGNRRCQVDTHRLNTRRDPAVVITGNDDAAIGVVTDGPVNLLIAFQGVFYFGRLFVRPPRDEWPCRYASHTGGKSYLRA